MEDTGKGLYKLAQWDLPRVAASREPGSTKKRINSGFYFTIKAFASAQKLDANA